MKKVAFLLSPFFALSFVVGCAEKVATTIPTSEITRAEAPSTIEEGKAKPEAESSSLTEDEQLALMPLVPVDHLAEPDLVGSQTSKVVEEKEDECTPWYKSWVFWTVVGAAAIGATTGVVLALEDTTPSQPYDYIIVRE